MLLQILSKMQNVSASLNDGMDTDEIGADDEQQHHRTCPSSWRHTCKQRFMRRESNDGRPSLGILGREKGDWLPGEEERGGRWLGQPQEGGRVDHACFTTTEASIRIKSKSRDEREYVCMYVCSVDRAPTSSIQWECFWLLVRCLNFGPCQSMSWVSHTNTSMRKFTWSADFLHYVVIHVNENGYVPPHLSLTRPTSAIPVAWETNQDFQ